MNQIKSNKQRVLKCKTPITVLALIALICTILSAIRYFAYYEKDVQVFHFPSFLALISLDVDIASKVLLVLYVLKFFKELKATIVVPIVFSYTPVTILLSFIDALNFHRRYNFIALIILILLLLGVVTIFALPIISALKGLSKKAFIVIPASLLLLYSAINLLALFLDFNIKKHYGTSYLFVELISIIALITFNIALLLFGLKNRIPSILAPSTKKGKKQMSPEQSLRLLKDEFDLGVITEEEYQVQRFDIISKL